MQLADARVSERPLFSERDRWFESAFLQRRVRCELDFSAAESGAWSGKRLIKLLLRARRFNTLAQGEDIPFAVLAQWEGVSPSYFTRLVHLSYLAPDITQAILDGRQPPRFDGREAPRALVARISWAGGLGRVA
jgi:hypothetical protein